MRILIYFQENVYKFLQNKIIPRYLVFFFILIAINSCEKLVEIDHPPSSISTEEVFQNKQEINGAISGIYYRMVNSTGTPGLTSGGMSYLGGLAADELLLSSWNTADLLEILSNSISPANQINQQYLWNQPYNLIFNINSVKEGIKNSNILTQDEKQNLEAELVVPLCLVYFYLTNIYGDIPITNTTNWRENTKLKRTSRTEVFDYLIEELEKAIPKLSNDYSNSGNERIVPNKWAAMALLSRIYLYAGKLDLAEESASSLIEKQIFQLEDVNTVFKLHSNEVIWQLKQNNSNYASTPEGIFFSDPFYNFMPPYILLHDSLLNSFEENDLRKDYWVKERVVNGQSYFHPAKYSGILPAPNTKIYESYYIIFRLTEQYFIRAEANARLNKLDVAIKDLNLIRERAGLNPLPETLSQEEILSAILHERRLEFFAEWGHRWFDLIRSGKGKSILEYNKNINVNPNAFLFPIPELELSINPNLNQNPGY